MQDFICTVCGLLSDKWERFPGNKCKACHATENDPLPVTAPDFTATISKE